MTNAILNFGSFMDQCGFDSAEWFSSVDATYKSGILFPDWVEKGKDVWHPFFMNPTLDSGETSHDAWCKNKDLDFVEYVFPFFVSSTFTFLSSMIRLSNDFSTRSL